jgi:hypothetical protein
MKEASIRGLLLQIGERVLKLRIAETGLNLSYSKEAILEIV